MAIPGIESVLQKLGGVASQAAGSIMGTSSAGAASATGGFAAELDASLRRVSAAQNGAEAQARAFEMGEPGVALNDVMVDLQKANIGFQMSLQVRNKLVSAYTTVMNMQV
ncbi:flagellar hook-basal body complex protein FliE [Pandoraea nosoerga]|uniref:Flagellar hook-basal body complex protein FliE n=1 Tax=Pandoraea nosoerga TaxID=2508296 RepID=A0A5E4XXB1_9BURK|nr:MULTISPECIES: flagellar hook-basal body complex protein FliE [Pandoraea]MBN4664790.1 flagellar hook-basal body complex protein FliE [Pandoraea nosoerga]MBN4674036.1 flagellar hook-basal body complex protein FliE [Pandoraea nosoerga]MBN4680030.1 flagellar hook-basal body complex protein FliE [Pandoraea nosoerga]MBN4744258.1 flagellar hook-basal body complex protein FliE [Pandoraea nosoerga]VVE41131.1 flagellar hook-basal body protein FliE [Pandoraea nosoerga]